MKILAIANILLLLLLSACERDREYIKDHYFSYQMQKDIEQNRKDLYRQSFVGVANEIPQNLQ